MNDKMKDGFERDVELLRNSHERTNYVEEYKKTLLLIDALNEAILQNNYGTQTGAEYVEEMNGCFGLKDLDRENMMYDLRQVLTFYLSAPRKMGGEIHYYKNEHA